MTPDEARAAIAARPRGQGNGRAVTMTAEERATRRKIASAAQNRAYVALKSLHEDEYQALYQTGLADLLAEAGLS